MLLHVHLPLLLYQHRANARLCEHLQACTGTDCATVASLIEAPLVKNAEQLAERLHPQLKLFLVQLKEEERLPCHAISGGVTSERRRGSSRRAVVAAYMRAAQHT